MEFYTIQFFFEVWNLTQSQRSKTVEEVSGAAHYTSLLLNYVASGREGLVITCVNLQSNFVYRLNTNEQEILGNLTEVNI